MEEIKAQLFVPGPLHDRRLEISEELTGIVKTGDLFFRLGKQSFMGIPFEKFVAEATKSEYSHASVAFVENNNVYLVEVNDMGTQKIALKDWIDFCANENFSVWRLPLTKIQLEELTKQIQIFLEEDPDYDFTFNVPYKFYCTESVCHIFEMAKIKLAKPCYLQEVTTEFGYFLICAISFYLKLIFKIGLPQNIPLYFIGNKENGIMSTSDLKQIWKSVV